MKPQNRNEMVRHLEKNCNWGKVDLGKILPRQKDTLEKKDAIFVVLRINTWENA